MDRRIFGIENEYGVTCTFRGQRRLSPDEVARYLFRRVVSCHASHAAATREVLVHVVTSFIVESPTMTCSLLNRSGSACGSSRVLMIGRLRVVALETPSQMCAARWLMQYTAPRGVWSTLPAPQRIWRVTSSSASRGPSSRGSSAGSRNMSAPVGRFAHDRIVPVSTGGRVPPHRGVPDGAGHGTRRSPRCGNGSLHRRLRVVRNAWVRPSSRAARPAPGPGARTRGRPAYGTRGRSRLRTAARGAPPRRTRRSPPGRPCDRTR
jgi:hypothetical protein